MKNQNYIKELSLWARYPVRRLEKYLLSKDRKIKVFCAYRYQSEQDILFCHGRTREEMKHLYKLGYLSKKEFNRLIDIFDVRPFLKEKPIETYTLDSSHGRGTGIDIKPIDFSYDDLKIAAAKFGIIQPLEDYRYHHEVKKTLIGARLYELVCLLGDVCGIIFKSGRKYLSLGNKRDTNSPVRDNPDRGVRL